MARREHFDEISIGTSGRLSNIEGTNLSVDANGNLNAASGDGGGGGGKGYLMEDFEGGLTGYSGDLTSFSIVTSDIEGGNMLRFEETEQTGSHQKIWTEAIETQRGERYAAYIRPNESASPTFVINGQLDAGGTLNAGYGVMLRPGPDEVRLIKETAAVDDQFYNPIDTAAVAINLGTIYRVEIDLSFGGRIEARVIDNTETTIATLTATDTDFDTGVLGWRDASGIGATSNFDFATRVPNQL